MAFVMTRDELQRLRSLRQKPEFRSAEMLLVFWETRLDIVARLLPPPLEPTPYPLATAFVAYYPETNFGPAYHEGALLLGAQFQGVPGNYCIAMLVTDDMAMAAGREAYGYPKKMAEIDFAKRGDDVAGRISRHGRTFFEVNARVGPASVDEAVRSMISSGLALGDEGGTPAYLFKHFLAPGGVDFDYPPRLVRQRNVLRPRRIEWSEAAISMPRSEDDPWHEVEVVRPLGGVFIVGDNTMLDGEVVAEVDADAFMPYAWSKWDRAQLRLPAGRGVEMGDLQPSHAA